MNWTIALKVTGCLFNCLTGLMDDSINSTTCYSITTKLESTIQIKDLMSFSFFHSYNNPSDLLVMNNLWLQHKFIGWVCTQHHQCTYRPDDLTCSILLLCDPAPRLIISMYDSRYKCVTVLMRFIRRTGTLNYVQDCFVNQLKWLHWQPQLVGPLTLIGYSIA